MIILLMLLILSIMYLFMGTGLYFTTKKGNEKFYSLLILLWIFAIFSDRVADWLRIEEQPF